MLATQAVIDAESPTFQVGEDAMGPRHDDVGGHRAYDMRVADDAGGARIGRSTVGLGGGAGFDFGSDERVRTFGRSILDRGEPHPANPAVVHFDGIGEQITARNDNLDLAWLLDDESEAEKHLTDPEDIAAAIMGHLRAARAEIETMTEELGGENGQSAEAATA